MAALPAGVQYGLSSESSYKENKELVFVKLTDSALKAIEDFIRNNRDKLAKPKIQFLPGNEGKISIPAGSNGTAGEATFHFSINSNAEMEGPQGSFECVRGGGARRLESCGPLPRRMRVQANDDSYEATKDRMARTIAAVQDKCTRVIKPNQTDIGRRVKVRSSHPLYSGGGGGGVTAGHHLPERGAGEARGERGVQQPAPRAAPPAHPPATQHQPQRPPPNPDLTRRSIKERLIQLLALKPFKKPELYARLNSEGIKEKERSVVNKILPQIGTLKDNCYHLRRHMWNDVNEEWPFYTEEEKRMLKRRKPQNLTPPLSSDSATSLSPRASPAPPKRRADDDDRHSKKQRISHYRRPEAREAVLESRTLLGAGLGGGLGGLGAGGGVGGAGSPSSGYATGGSGASSGERHASDTEDDRNVKKDNGYTLSFNTIKDLCPSPAAKPEEFAPTSPHNHHQQTNITEAYAHVPEKDITSSEPLDNPMETETELTSALDDNHHDYEEIERQYPPITSSSMRRAYKDEFASLYSEYVRLYESVARVAALFTRLEKQLKKVPKHDPHYQEISSRIVCEYRRVRSDAAYQAQRARVNYLHTKLTIIKRRVAQYDHHRNLKPARSAAAPTTQAY